MTKKDLPPGALFEGCIEKALAEGHFSPAETIDSAILRAINVRSDLFIKAKGHPEKILLILKDIIIDPSVPISLKKWKEKQ